MNSTDYDVVVVGGGPAGLITAKTCAENGLNVVILEKDAEIGAPKRCAEGVSIRGFDRVGLKYEKSFVSRELRGAKLYSPSGKVVSMMAEGTDVLGYVLERKVFEKYLARLAIKAGASCLVKTTVTDVIKEKNKIVGVRANHMGSEFELRAKIVIACDGVESMVAKKAGLDTVNKLEDYISGFQYEMAGIKNCDMDVIHLYFGTKIAPKGYLWIFPKSEDSANVGIGIIGTMNASKNAKEYLDRFIVNHPEIFEDASPIEVNGGGVPVSGYIPGSFVMDGLMLVGDSAQMVNPIHGGGMTTNMYAGTIAGRVAAEAIKSGDVSEKKLKAYEKEWKETDGVKMQKLLKLRLFLEKLNDSDFELFSEILSSKDLMEIQDGKTKFLLKSLLKHPSLLNLARKYLA